MFDAFLAKLFSQNKAIRKLSNTQNALYLTFDDGPDEEFTEHVLGVLKQTGAQATFFVIGQRAQKYPEVIKKIINEGHSLGNHSVDHAYGRLFSRSLSHLKEWVEMGETNLFTLAGKKSVGFRPPNGVVTPTLMRALIELNVPLVLWNCRFFDTLKKWDNKTALKALPKLESGDIILLHDKQKKSWQEGFLLTLELFIIEGQKRGFTFKALPQDF